MSWTIDSSTDRSAFRYGWRAAGTRLHNGLTHVRIGTSTMPGWLLYLALGLLTYWLYWGAPDWASIGLWLVVIFWPLVLIWQIGWWLLKVAVAVTLALFALSLAYDFWQRTRP
jgi:hypothetical protein